MATISKILRPNARTLAKKITALRSDQHGASAIEFALFAGILCFGLLNTADISIYIYKRMQVENASEMSVQAAWKACDPSNSQLPATVNCPGLTTAITQAAQSTTLGNNVTIQTGSPAEAYYCLNSSGALQNVGAVSSPPPADCTVTGQPSSTAGRLHPNHNNIFVCAAISWCHRRQRVYNANCKNRNDAVELTCANFTKISPMTNAVRRQSNLPLSDQFLSCFLSASYICACASPLSAVCILQWKKVHVVHPSKQRSVRIRVVPSPIHKTIILGRALFQRSPTMRRQHAAIP